VKLGHLLAALALAAAALPASAVEWLEPPEHGFYAKRLSYSGIAIKSHRSVDDRALLAARDRVARMLRALPVVRQNLAAAGAELHIIGAAQSTSDLPEHRHLKGRPFEGSLTIDERTRGVGGLLASCGEENLLALPRDRYAGQDICVHEFAHGIYMIGMDAPTRAAFAAHYAAARASGRWRGTFAETNVDEFFAELSMWYFGTAPGPQWLAAHDPESYALIDRFYRGRLEVRPGIWQAGGRLDALKEAQLRSGRTHDAARLLIRNRTAAELRLYWLDFDGVRKPYMSVPPFGFALQETYAEHAWLLLDPTGASRALTVAGRPGSVIVVE
jgi:hypothetical protein